LTSPSGSGYVIENCQTLERYNVVFDTTSSITNNTVFTTNYPSANTCYSVVSSLTDFEDWDLVNLPIVKEYDNCEECIEDTDFFYVWNINVPNWEEYTPYTLETTTVEWVDKNNETQTAELWAGNRSQPANLYVISKNAPIITNGLNQQLVSITTASFSPEQPCVFEINTVPTFSPQIPPYDLDYLIAPGPSGTLTSWTGSYPFNFAYKDVSGNTQTLSTDYKSIYGRSNLPGNTYQVVATEITQSFLQSGQGDGYFTPFTIKLLKTNSTITSSLWIFTTNNLPVNEGETNISWYDRDNNLKTVSYYNGPNPQISPLLIQSDYQPTLSGITNNVYLAKTQVYPGKTWTIQVDADGPNATSEGTPGQNVFASPYTFDYLDDTRTANEIVLSFLQGQSTQNITEITQSQALQRVIPGSSPVEYEYWNPFYVFFNDDMGAPKKLWEIAFDHTGDFNASRSTGTRWKDQYLYNHLIGWQNISVDPFNPNSPGPQTNPIYVISETPPITTSRRDNVSCTELAESGSSVFIRVKAGTGFANLSFPSLQRLPGSPTSFFGTSYTFTYKDVNGITQTPTLNSGSEYTFEITEVSQSFMLNTTFGVSQLFWNPFTIEYLPEYDNGYIFKSCNDDTTISVYFSNTSSLSTSSYYNFQGAPSECYSITQSVASGSWDLTNPTFIDVFTSCEDCVAVPTDGFLFKSCIDNSTIDVYFSNTSSLSTSSYYNFAETPGECYVVSQSIVNFDGIFDYYDPTITAVYNTCQDCEDQIITASLLQRCDTGDYLYFNIFDASASLQSGDVIRNNTNFTCYTFISNESIPTGDLNGGFIVDDIFNTCNECYYTASVASILENCNDSNVIRVRLNNSSSLSINDTIYLQEGNTCYTYLGSELSFTSSILSPGNTFNYTGSYEDCVDCNSAIETGCKRYYLVFIVNLPPFPPQGTRVDYTTCQGIPAFYTGSELPTPICSLTVPQVSGGAGLYVQLNPNDFCT
jgi:hypothetical protein